MSSTVWHIMRTEGKRMMQRDWEKMGQFILKKNVHVTAQAETITNVRIWYSYEYHSVDCVLKPKHKTTISLRVIEITVRSEKIQEQLIRNNTANRGVIFAYYLTGMLLKMQHELLSGVYQNGIARLAFLKCFRSSILGHKYMQTWLSSSHLQLPIPITISGMERKTHTRKQN
jgi:hypothetical protein